ncbi:MAG: peptidoglycan-binding protein [Clostridia bacterium]
MVSLLQLRCDRMRGQNRAGHRFAVVVTIVAILTSFAISTGPSDEETGKTQGNSRPILMQTRPAGEETPLLAAFTPETPALGTGSHAPSADLQAALSQASAQVARVNPSERDAAHTPPLADAQTASPQAGTQTAPSSLEEAKNSLKPAASVDPSRLKRIRGFALSSGHTGADVKQLQSWLIATGYLPEGEADGIYGSKTARAIESFQSDNQLTNDGVATVATQYLLALRVGAFTQTAHGAYRTGTDAYGVVCWDDASFYIGAIKAEKQHRRGLLRYADGGWYDGSFKDGLRSGAGEMYFFNGDYYKGNWKNDLMDGKGVYHFGSPNSTEKYDGMWKQGQMWGKGRYTLPSGDKISGSWQANQYML